MKIYYTYIKYLASDYLLAPF